MIVDFVASRTKICHRYSVETASGILGVGHLWPEERKQETLNIMRSLPTYDKTTDTVVVCWYIYA